ncbi:MAG TPA: pentapeptide repeat-containing protein [Bdellovibrionota bacterium]|jgi:uncharacterized protein YjbI with pentapeptide repeats|nr:pentapeptide repeat-containing protein [Bdellovibrionota bacterium]
MFTFQFFGGALCGVLLGSALAVPADVRAEGVPVESFINYFLIETDSGAQIAKAIMGREVRSLRDAQQFQSVLGLKGNAEFRGRLDERLEVARRDFRREMRATDRPYFSLTGIDTQFGGVFARHLSLDPAAGDLVFFDPELKAGSYSDSAQDFLAADDAKVIKRFKWMVHDGSNLSQLNMQGVDASGINLSGMADMPNIGDARLDFSDFSGASFKNVGFNRRTQMDFASFYGADLQNARFGQAGAYGLDLRNANLRGADLTKVDLYHPDLRGANLQGARLDRALLSEGDLRGADFTGASMKGTIFYDENGGTQLQGAIMDGADLEGTSFADLDISRTRFNNANLRGAIFTPSTRLPFSRTEALARGMVLRK